MTQLAEQESTYRRDHDRVLGRAGEAWEWFAPTRREAMARFEEMGLPTTRDEEWRFTNIKPIRNTDFALAEPGGTEKVTQADVDRAAIAGLDGPRLVFVDGRLREDLSDLSALPEGVAAMPLSRAIAEAPEVVQAHLAQYADFSQDAFTALNTALAEDGVFVHVGRNTVAEQPIYVIMLSTAPETPQATHPRNLLVAEQSSEATVIEHYASADEGVHLANSVTEAVCGPNAHLRHYFIEEESEQAFNISTLRSHQHRDSGFESHTALLGGDIVRNNIRSELHGENGHSLINGLFVPHHRQHMDNHMRVVHAEPQCGSRQFYRGILNDEARGVFSGRIVVYDGAQQTDAEQTNRNLLLTDETQVDTKPQLEIFADDVKCTHGATTGQLDEQALFYLRSRGISEAAARGMLIYAFAHESLDRMGLPAVRRHLEHRLIERLPESRLLANLFE